VSKESTNQLQDLQVILEAIPDVILVLDPQEMVAYCFSHGNNLLTLSADDCKGKPIKALLPANFVAPIQEALAEVSEKGSTAVRNLKSKGPNKSLWFELTVRYMPDYPLPYILILRDITAKQQATITLQESEARFRAVIEQSEEGIILVDEQGKIILWNKGQEKICGYTAEETMGKPLWEVMAEMERPELNHKVNARKNQLRNRINKLLKQQDKEWLNHSLEHEIITKNGESHIIQSVFFPVELTDRLMIGSINRDITLQKYSELALHEGEEYVRALYADSTVPLVVIDEKNLHVFDLNRAALQISGYDKRDDLIGKPFADLISEESPVSHDAMMQQIRSHAGNDMELELLRPDGSCWTAKLSVMKLAVMDEGLIQLTLIDISKQKKAARQLEETTLRLEAVFAAMPDTIYVIDKDGIYRDAFYNEQSPAQHKPRLVKGLHLNHVFDEDNAKKILNAIRLSLLDGKIQVVDYQAKNTEGEYFYEARISRMDEEKAMMIVRDTTSIRALENDLLYNNKLLQTLTQLATRFINLPIGLIDQEIDNALAQIGAFANVDRAYIFDYDWENDTMSNTYEWCSPGTTPEIQNLQNIPNGMLPQWVKAHKAGNMTVVQSIKDLNPEDPLYQILEPQGIQSLITIPLMQSAAESGSESKCIGYVGFDVVGEPKNFSDNDLSILQIFAELLTNLKIKQKADALLKENQHLMQLQNDQLVNLNERLRKQNEEIIVKNRELDHEREKAEASDKLKTAFLNNISHEVRTPLNGIIGFSQLLNDIDASVEDKNDYVDALNMSVDRLTDTFNDIMDVSLLMSGNMPLNIETIPLRMLIGEVEKKHQQLAQAKGIEIHVSIPEALQNLSIDTDRGFIVKIMNELTGNAVKYTHQGFVELGYARHHDELMLFVKDTGIGISAEALPEIYEPFSQEDYSTTRSQEGAGLGLTIVRGIVDLLQGTIKVESEPNKGTKIEIYIPINASREMELKKESPSLPMKNQNDEWPTILVAEDEDLNILYTKRIFKPHPFNMIFVRNGSEAVKVVQEHPQIDLVLMDIKMPVMDGLEATRLIKASHPNLVIVAVTAYAANDDRYMCLNAGCDDYVTKPFKPAELFDTIRKWLPAVGAKL
jgi:PAS domain S-box-containing protein